MLFGVALYLTIRLYIRISDLCTVRVDGVAALPAHAIIYELLLSGVTKKNERNGSDSEVICGSRKILEVTCRRQTTE